MLRDQQAEACYENGYVLVPKQLPMGLTDPFTIAIPIDHGFSV